jgi:hypothetical protein
VPVQQLDAAQGARCLSRDARPPRLAHPCTIGGSPRRPARRPVPLPCVDSCRCGQGPERTARSAVRSHHRTLTPMRARSRKGVSDLERNPTGRCRASGEDALACLMIMRLSSAALGRGLVARPGLDHQRPDTADPPPAPHPRPHPGTGLGRQRGTKKRGVGLPSKLGGRWSVSGGWPWT